MSAGAKRESAPKSGRRSSVARTTRETDITVDLIVDGAGDVRVDTGVRFLDHMIETFGRHGLFDLRIKARGDLDVDQHHTVEDVGLVLGQAFREALGDKAGICRFGDATCPLDEALMTTVVDIGGRPFLVYEVELKQFRVGSFDAELVHDFLLALVTQLGMNLHMTMVRGRNTHHIVEAGFKSLARAMDQATRIDPRVTGIPSTKGTL
jgi:imidazoleglycerol-phosphate dehydratase